MNERVTYRLVALDLDGTVLTNKKEISPRTREALRAARERGVITVVATGRAVHAALYFSREIGGGPVICCNGAGILDEHGTFLMRKPIPLPVLEPLLDLGREEGLLVECYTESGIVLDRPGRQIRAYMRWVRPSVSWSRAALSLFQLWRRNQIRAVRSLQRWIRRPGIPAVLKLMVIGEPPGLQRLAGRIQRQLPQLEVTSSAPDNLEITAAGVSKGAALELLAAWLKVPRAAILAVGDSDNDLTMIRCAGTGVAMGNATDPIKAAADRVTATCDEDGVARIIEELCLT